MDVAKSYNVPVPKIYKVIDDKNLGKGFFMEFIEGVALGNKIVDNNFLKSKKVNLSEQCGYHLSKIHKINHTLNTSIFYGQRACLTLASLSTVSSWWT